MLIFSLIFSSLVIIKIDSLLSKSSDLEWLPPLLHDWKRADISANVKLHWENRWAKAFFAKGCTIEDNLKIIPVYYWPGDRVDLTCRMCHLANMMNGRMKRWGYAFEIEEFLRNPAQLVRVNENWKQLENKNRSPLEHIYMPNINSKHQSNLQNVLKDEHLFWQNEGKLTIFNSDVSNQGVYFCYDAESKKNTYYFYLLMAMIPPVKIATESPSRFNDNCGSRNGVDNERIGPSFNWKFHFIPMGNMFPVDSCLANGDCEKWYPYLDRTNYPKNFDEKCNMERCSARLIGPQNTEIDVSIELRWDEYTSCEGEQATKRREAHCYLKRGKGSIHFEDIGEQYQWIENLENLLGRAPFHEDGVRLYSSVVTSAIFGREKLTNCYNSDDGSEYEYYDQVWREILLPSMGVKSSGPQNQLRNPFEACLRYGREKEEHIQGTYSTQVEYC